MRECHRVQALLLLTSLLLSSYSVHGNQVVYGSNTPPHDVISVEMNRLRRQRISYVRHMLCERYHHVQSGKRGNAFHKWVNRSGGPTILSTHGLDIDDAVLDVMAADKDYQEALDLGNRDILDLSDDTLFPRDMRDMGLVPILGIPSMYPGDPIHLIDDRPPSYFMLMLRFITLSIKFSPVTSTAWLAFLSTKFREKVWYKWLSSCLASGGPAWIKWGQWAATREDMFPEALCSQLENLHSDAPAHSWKFTQKMMESSLGLPRGSLLDVFESFDPVPVASGSIAQVHKAVLRGERRADGVLVAVKVRHPRVSQHIDMDFRIMSGMARMVDMIPALSWLHIRESVNQFSHTMAAQAHLNVESHHLEVFNNNFRNWPQVSFPKPFYSSSSVIIETYEHGTTVSKILDTYDALAADISSEIGQVSVEEADEDCEVEGHGHELIPIELAKFIVTTGVSVYLKMLLADNLMHADLHYGNIMLDIHQGGGSLGSNSSSTALVPVGADHKVMGQPGVCLVDAGMVAQLTNEESENFIGLLCSLGDGDGTFAAECALRFSKDTDLSDEEKQAFTNDVCLIFQERCKGYGTDVDVGDVLRGIMGLIRKHRVRIDANYATLVVNALCVESLARRVCPSYNVLDAARPMLQTYRRIAYTKDGKSRKVRRFSVTVTTTVSVLPHASLYILSTRFPPKQ